ISRSVEAFEAFTLLLPKQNIKTQIVKINPITFFIIPSKKHNISIPHLKEIYMFFIFGELKLYWLFKRRMIIKNHIDNKKEYLK
ncbi:MAG: hypothetical protein K6F81_05855, partial [Acholeplasmatales bacterium]|nr:hypothetical protein [Acholeplasmatales bacterium]